MAILVLDRGPRWEDVPEAGGSRSPGCCPASAAGPCPPRPWAGGARHGSRTPPRSRPPSPAHGWRLHGRLCAPLSTWPRSWAPRFDPELPLWEAVVVEGIDGDRGRGADQTPPRRGLRYRGIASYSTCSTGSPRAEASLTTPPLWSPPTKAPLRRTPRGTGHVIRSPRSAACRHRSCHDRPAGPVASRPGHGPVGRSPAGAGPSTSVAPNDRAQPGRHLEILDLSPDRMRGHGTHRPVHAQRRLCRRHPHRTRHYHEFTVPISTGYVC